MMAVLSLDAEARNFPLLEKATYQTSSEWCLKIWVVTEGNWDLIILFICLFIYEKKMKISEKNV
jgi:hypothetical protein